MMPSVKRICRGGMDCAQWAIGCPLCISDDIRNHLMLMINEMNYWNDSECLLIRLTRIQTG
jgi:hypothetical protein